MRWRREIDDDDVDDDVVDVDVDDDVDELKLAVDGSHRLSGRRWPVSLHSTWSIDTLSLQSAV